MKNKDVVIELLLLIEKWMDIFKDMNSLKKKNMDKNKEITKPEHLLEDVIQKKTE